MQSTSERKELLDEKVARGEGPVQWRCRRWDFTEDPRPPSTWENLGYVPEYGRRGAEELSCDRPPAKQTEELGRSPRQLRAWQRLDFEKKPPSRRKHCQHFLEAADTAAAQPTPDLGSHRDACALEVMMADPDPIDAQSYVNLDAVGSGRYRCSYPRRGVLRHPGCKPAVTNDQRSAHAQRISRRWVGVKQEVAAR